MNESVIASVFIKKTISTATGNVDILKIESIEIGLVIDDFFIYKDKMDKVNYVPLMESDIENDRYAFIYSLKKFDSGEINTHEFESIYKGYQSVIGTFFIKKEDSIKEVRDSSLIDHCNNLFADTKKEDIKFSEEKESVEEVNIKDIYENIKKYVINQDEQIKDVLTAVYKNQLLIKLGLSKDIIARQKQNILIAGGTGTGKTEMVKQIAFHLHIPVVIEDITRYTEAGYVGGDIDDIFKHLCENANKNIELAEHSVLVLDEFDKLANNEDSHSFVSRDGVQRSLLSILEGKKVMISSKSNPANNFEFDTSKLTVICLGAFSGIEEVRKKNKKVSIGFNSNVTIGNDNIYDTTDYIKYGIMPEIIGRIDKIVHMNPLYEKELINILLNSINSPLTLERDFYSLLGISLVYDDVLIAEIAKEAVKLNCGARGLKKVVELMFKDAHFEVLSELDRYKVLKLDAGIVKDPKKHSFK